MTTQNNTGMSHVMQSYLIPCVLLMFFISEAVGKYGVFMAGLHFKFAMMVKLVFMITVSILMVRLMLLKLAPIVIICLVFLIGQLGLNSGFDLTVLTNASKYIFPLLILLFFSSELNLYPVNRSMIIYTFERLIVLNSVLIYVGALWGIYLFKTYTGARFGYSGLLNTSALSTYFYYIAMVYLMEKYRVDFYKKPLFYVAGSAALLVGTKALYVGVPLICVIYGFSFKKVSSGHIYIS